MDSLEDRLGELQAAVAAIPDDQADPEPTLDVLGLNRNEGAWQEYLSYFLDPGRPHGLQHRFLDTTFDHLEAANEVEFRPTEFELATSEYIEVETEWSTDQGNIVDIVVYEEESWFLCIELKVDSAEGGGARPQTVRYADDPGVVPGSTDVYEEAGYLYIAPGSAPPSSSPEFVDVAWKVFVDIVDAVLLDATTTLPARTVSQLSDFKETIETQLMTSIDDDIQRRKDLYFQYRDSINTVEEAIEPFVSNVLQNDWATVLETDHRPTSATQMEWHYSAVGNSYGQIRLPSWCEVRDDEPFLDIHFEHKPKTKEFKQGRLTFLLELEEPDRSTISRNSGKRYHKFRDDLLEGLPDVIEATESPNWSTVEVDPGSSQKKLMRALYRYEPGDETGYYTALAQAIDDHQDVATFVSKTLESTDYSAYPK